MATANSKLKIDYGFDSYGTSNVNGDFRVSGNVFFGGTIISALSTNGDFIPIPSGLLLGNNINRWTLFADSGSFSNTLTVTGAGSFQDELTVTKTINASNNVIITGFANATVSVNSALLTVGSSFIANTVGAYHTGTINAASHTIGTSFIANSTAIIGGGYANITTSVNSALLTVGTSFIANTTGAYHTGTVNAASHTTTGFVANTTAIAPTSNTFLLGNNIGRFVISANTADFSGTVTGTVANMSTSVNSALLTIGTVFIANATGAYHTGTVNAASYTTSGFVANTTAIAPTSNTILLGNSIGRFVLSANTADLSGQLTVSGNTTLTGNATLGGILQTIAGNSSFDSGVLFVDSVANRVGVNNTAPMVAFEVSGAANVSTSVNSALFTVGNSFIANATGTYPGSNTLGTALGSSTQRWVINANTINASGLITGSAGATITGQSNLVDVTVSGNLTVSGTTTYINTTTLNVGDNIITLNADLGALVAPTESAGLEVNRGSSANVSFLWNETSDSWTAGNTDITGYANASVSVNSAVLSVGTAFIANTLGAYHTGIVNAASYTTTGFVANTTVIAPTSNTILLGNTIGRFVLSANTINASGLITGSAGADITGQVNASTGFGSGTINATSNGLISNSTTITVGNTSVNVAITTSGITSSGGTGVNPSSNTLGTSLGTSTQRWVLNANTGSFSGAVSGITTLAAGNTTVTGFANVTTSIQGGSSLTIAGALSGVTTAAVGNTTITGFANASVSVNSALLTVGTSFIANVTGAYHTGVVNAASHTVGSSFIANSSAVVITTPLTANSTTGTSGQFLVSNGAIGSPYWITGSVATVTDDVSTNASRYLLFANQTSGSLSAAYVSSTQLSYNPSTGTLSSTVMTGSSDERLKTNIETIANPLSTISQLRGVSFNRINNNHKDYGVIAQEIEKILPDVVYTDADGFKTVSYSSIIGFLIEAVKKQQEQIDILMQDKYPK